MANKNIETVNSLPDELRQELSNIVETRKETIIQALLDLAHGIWREEIKTDAKGLTTTRIYQEKPDKEVAQYLMNQIIGKPKETVSVTGRVNFIMDE